MKQDLESENDNVDRFPLAVKWKRARICAGGIALLLFMTLLMTPTTVNAKKVYSPIVEQGELEFEYILDYSLDSDPRIDGSARHQFELEYGVTDRWMTGVVGDFRKRRGQAFAYQGVKWENIYQLFEEGARWLDAGLYFEYIIPDASFNKPDVIELKLLLEKEQGRWIHTTNLILKKELGANAVNHTIAAYAWRSKWRWKKMIEPALELYGTIGELGNSTGGLSAQSHQIGPVLLGKLPGSFSYQLGYLSGLTPASDKGMFKFVFGYEF